MTDSGYAHQALDELELAAALANARRVEADYRVHRIEDRLRFWGMLTASAIDPVVRSEPYRVHLSALSIESTRATCSASDACILDIGYVLSHESELIQVVAVTANQIRVGRGYGGSTRSTHAGADWKIVNAGTLIAPGAPLSSSVRCRTCGAPDQAIGVKCHYCAVRVDG